MEEVGWKEEEISTHDDYLADFIADFHAARSLEGYPALPQTHAGAAVLSRFAGARLGTARAGIEWNRVSECATRSRYMPGLFQASTGLSRPPFGSVGVPSSDQSAI
jgi:hypothetical protein